MSQIRQSSVFVRTSTVGFSSGYRWRGRGRASGWGQLLWATRAARLLAVLLDELTDEPLAPQRR